MTSTHLLLIVGFVLGCGAPSMTVAEPSGERVAVADASTIPSTWDELLEISDAVYFGAWSLDQSGGGCLSVEQVLHGSDTRPEPLCATSDELVDESQWIDSSGPNVYAFITLSSDGEAQITAVANEQLGLLEIVRCGRVGRFWTDAPEAHRRCEADADCEALSAMCFSDAVATSYAEPYRDVASRFGGSCLAPDEGACPPENYHAACISGQCRAIPER